jgi:hypothetical protein
MLLRLIILGVVVLILLLANIQYVKELYLTRQLTPAGLIINSAIVLIFLIADEDCGHLAALYG